MCLAMPGRVLEIQPDSLMTSRVAFGSTIQDVSLALVPEARVGDYVVVHAGAALQILDEEAAAHISQALAEARDDEGSR